MPQAHEYLQLAGLSLTIGILAALRSRDVTSVGQKVDVALVDSVVGSLEIITLIYLTEGKIPQRIDNCYESVYAQHAPAHGHSHRH